MARRLAYPLEGECHVKSMKREAVWYLLPGLAGTAVFYIRACSTISVKEVRSMIE